MPECKIWRLLRHNDQLLVYSAIDSFGFENF